VRRLLAITLLGVVLGGCTSAFYLSDADVATYTAQLGTETGANETLAMWNGAIIRIEFTMTGSGPTQIPRIQSSNLREVFRERGVGRFPSESLERTGAEVERELDTWIGPEMASLADRLGAKLKSLRRVALVVTGAPVFAFDPARGVVTFALTVQASVTGDVDVPDVGSYSNVRLDVSDYRVTGALSFGAPHPQGTRVRLTATPRPGRLSVVGIDDRRVSDAIESRLAAPLSASVDVTRTLSYGQLAVPTLQFVQDPPSGGLWAGLATAPARAGESWMYRTSQWDRWATYPESQVLTGDFNGDGKTDVLSIDMPASGAGPYGIWVGLSDGQQLATSRWATWVASRRLTVLTGDFNGDGKTDILLSDPGRPGLWVGLSDGRSFTFREWAPQPVEAEWRVLVGDFNGDRRTDVLIVEVPRTGTESRSLRVGLSDGNGRFVFDPTPWASWDTNRDIKLLVGDFNGDGKADVMKFDVPSSGTATLGLWVGLSDGSRFTTSEWARWETYREMKVLVGDFNGDGKADVMKFDVPSSGNASLGLWVGLSDGSRFATSEWARWDSYRDAKVLAADFDGDGKTDVMKFDVPDMGSQALGLWVGRSDGGRFVTSEWARWDNSPGMKVIAGDFDGDGKADVMKVDVGSASAPHLQSTYLARPDVPDPTLHVVARSPAGRLVHGRREGGAWSAFAPLTMTEAASSDPAMVGSGSDRLDVVAVATTGRLLHATLREGVWAEVVTSTQAGSVRFAASRPALLATAPGQLEAVALSADGLLQHVRRLDGRWVAPRAVVSDLQIGSGLVTPPFRDPVLSQAGNKLLVLFVDQRARLFSVLFDLEVGSWGYAYEVLGARVRGVPALASCGDGSLDMVYARQSDGALVHQRLSLFTGSVGSEVRSNPLAIGRLSATGDPTLVCSGYRRLELLVPGPNREVFHNHYTISGGNADGRSYIDGWQEWQRASDQLVRSEHSPTLRGLGPMEAVTSSTGQVHVVGPAWVAWRGTSRAGQPLTIWHNSFLAQRWGRERWVTVHWRGWQEPAGPSVLGRPALALVDRHVDVVLTGRDGGLRRAPIADGIPARFTGGPAIASPRPDAVPMAVATAPGVLDVLYLGVDERLHHLRYLDGRTAIDVRMDQRPGLTSPARPGAVSVAGHLEVVVRASDATLKHWRYRAGRWEGPLDVPDGGNVISAPALVGTGAGRLELFAVRGDDQRVYHWRFENGHWTPPRVLVSDVPMNAVLFTGLAASSWGDGSVDLIVAESSSRRMLHRHVAPGQPTATPGFVAIGGPPADSIALIALGPANLRVLGSTAGDRQFSMWSVAPPLTRQPGLRDVERSAPPVTPRRGPVGPEIGAPLVWSSEVFSGRRLEIAGMAALGARDLLAGAMDSQGRVYLGRFLDWRWSGFAPLYGQPPEAQPTLFMLPGFTGR